MATVRRDPQVLEGVEVVRSRPGMYVGGTGEPGALACVLEIVGNAFDQYLQGLATRLEVALGEDGWITVADDGAGFPAEPAGGCVATVVQAFTTLHTTPTLDGHRPHVHIRTGMPGVGAGVVGALSEALEVSTACGDLLVEARFSRGALVAEPRTRPAVGRRGTTVAFKLDRTIFEAPRLTSEALEPELHRLGTLAPGLVLMLDGRRMGRRGGLVGWLEELEPRAVRASLLEVARSLDDIDVHVALCWAPRRSERFRSFVNYSATDEHGHHLEGLMAAVKACSPTELVGRRAARGLSAIVHVGLLHPRFGGPTRARLFSVEAGQAVRSAVEARLEAAPWWYDLIAEHLP